MLAQLRRPLLVLTVFASTGLLLYAQRETKPAPAAAMIETATELLASLNDQDTERATFKYDDPERLNWHFIPRERRGLPLKDLEGEPLHRATALIRSGLSEAGYEQTLNVMSLEEVLYLLEGGDRETRRSKRDPGKYYLSIFGKPAVTGTWGWRVEGHHLSLNYVISEGKVVSSTPEFFGANPGTIDAGLDRQIRVLGPEEDLARQVLKLCSPDQKKLAYQSDTAPREIRFAGEAQPKVTEPVGLPVSKMSADQKKMLGQLLGEYLKNMPQVIEQRRRQQIEAAGYDDIYFAWWGGEELNEPHYYRVQGPTFLIEYNNTQNNANHVHSIYRDLGGDFNESL